jgi:hypothetical protein
MVELSNTSPKILTLFVVGVLLFGFFNIEQARGNFSPGPLDIKINSPHSGEYTANQTTLSVTITVYADSLNSSDHRWIAYSIDGQGNESMIANYEGVTWSGGFPFSVVTAQTVLTDLSVGSHSIVVCAKYYYSNSWVSQGRSEIQFRVGISPKPILTIDAPTENQVFENLSIPYLANVTVIPAAFKDNKIYGNLFSIAYTIDNEKPVEIASHVSIESAHLTYTGNLYNLEDGNHSIKILAAWASPDGGDPLTLYSNETHFSVENKLAESPNILAANLPLLSIVSIIITLTIAIIAFKHFSKIGEERLPVAELSDSLLFESIKRVFVVCSILVRI